MMDATENKDSAEVAETANDGMATHGDIQSNHNTSHPVDPVRTANLIGKPDYNPMREAGNRANDKSDTTLVPETSKALVEEKGGRPTVAEDTMNGKTLTGEAKPDNNNFVFDPATGIRHRPNSTALADEIEERDDAMAGKTATEAKS